MSTKIGLECKTYYWAGPRVDFDTDKAGFIVINPIRDATLSMEKSEIDASSRGGNGWRQNKTGLKNARLEMTCIWDPEDAAFTAMLDAFINNTQIVAAALDGAHTDTPVTGLYTEWEVQSFSEPQPLEDNVVAEITLIPARGALAPEWVSVGTS